MTDSTPTVPNSTELQDLLTRVLETNQDARTASSERNHALIVHGRESDPYRAAHRAALAASVTAGAAEDDMRKAIRHAATVLDHVHVCNKPTSADLVREVARLHRENERLRDQVETLGGNADWSPLHTTNDQATCECPSCRHYEAVNATLDAKAV